MKLVRIFNFRKSAETRTRRNEIVKRIADVEKGLDEGITGKNPYNAVSPDINEIMAKQTCKCANETIDGIFQCQYGCACNSWRRTCSLECACEGMCVPNTFLHLPKVDVRLGIAGEELFTTEDIDSGRLAFVFTGEMTSLKKYLKSIKDKRIDLNTIVGKWQGERLQALGKDGVPTFVLNTYKEVAGFANHSCDPNVEVFEIWQNGKLYIVGKTMKYCFVGDSLTFDYNWEYPDDVKYAEICLCGSRNCRAFIARVSLIVMQRSIPRYVAILNEMETHNIYELQRLDRLKMALHTNLPLSKQAEIEVENLKHHIEELRLTKQKAIFLKKGILLAKAKLAELEIIDEVEKSKHKTEATYSHLQTLPDFGDEIDFESFKSVDSRFTHSTCQSCNQLVQDSNDEVDSLSTTSKALASYLPTNSNKDVLNGETLPLTKFSKEHCLSESRVTQALQNDGLPLSVKIPLPLKDNNKCVLMGVEDIDRLLAESKLTKHESSRSFSSFFDLTKCVNPSFDLPKCASPSCFSLQSSKSIKKNPYSSNTPYLNQYDLAMKTSCLGDVEEKLSVTDTTQNIARTKEESRGKTKTTNLDTINVEEKIKNAEDWEEGLFTQDEIHRIFSWIEGTIHARGESSQLQPWPKAKEWAYWLHKNFRHPTPIELETHTKTWTGISTNTLRACNTGKTPNSRTLPLVRDVRTLLSDVLTFIPFKFTKFKLGESKKSGNIWRIVSNKVGEPLPGNPMFQTTGCYKKL